MRGAHHRRPVRSLVVVTALVTLGACADDDGASGPDAEPPVATDDDGTTDDGLDEDGTTDDGLDEDGTTDDGLDEDGTDDDATDDDDADDATDDDEVEQQGAPPLDAEASTEDREREAVDAALSLVDVRVGAHDGFDRVVFELEGDGEVGWYLTLSDEARAHGSGNVVDVAGDAVLTVDLVGVRYPMDAPEDVTTFEQERLEAPGNAGVITELVNNHIYEGHHQLFVGANEQVPYRVARYEDPQRVVIDLLHP